MLVNYHAPKHVYIVCGNTDLRKGIDTLAILIADNFGLIFTMTPYFYFVDGEMIGLGFFTGTVKGSYYFTSGLITDV